MWLQTDTQTVTQTRVTTIHFASSTTYAKCNNNENKGIAEHSMTCTLGNSDMLSRPHHSWGNSSSVG